MRTQSKLIILRENSGSGKSTVAKELQQKLGRGTLLISQDLVRREMNLHSKRLTRLVSFGLTFLLCTTHS